MGGESIVEAQIFENKMGESVISGASLEPSVSFGRFENDSLSWEKWSTFSPNKYLEEVEKCSTPGSVAQKRAYFEAHYKKIAAQKAEQLELEKLMEPVSSVSDESKSENHIENTFGNGTEFSICNGERSTEAVEQEVDVGNVMNSTTFDDIKEDVGSAGECQSFLVEEFKEELTCSQSINTTESNDREKVVLLEDEHTSQKSIPDVVKQDQEVESETKRASESEKKILKVKARNITQKKTPTKKDQALAGTKKKVVSPAAKSSPVSAPRLSKTAPMSASQSSSKKLNSLLLPRNKDTPVRENRRVAPTSLHMSLSLGPANSFASPASTRKSLIMEQMADKDIIKRAFKAFQNNYGQLRSSFDDKFDRASQVSSEVPERKVTPSLTPRKENEGLRKAADKRTIPRGQSGTKFSSTSSGFGSLVHKKNVKAVTPSVGLESDERAERRREFLKKLEQKSIAREAEKAQLTAKSKEKDGDMGKLKQNSNLKAMPARTYPKGGVSKSSQNEGVKSKISRPIR